MRKYIFGNLSRMTYVSESESRSESSQNRDALKTQKFIHNIPLLPIGLFPAIFNISKKSWKNKEFKFSQFDTFNFVICVRVSCCDKFSAYTTESKQNNTTSRYSTCTVNSTRKHLKIDYLFDKTL